MPAPLFIALCLVPCQIRSLGQVEGDLCLACPLPLPHLPPSLALVHALTVVRTLPGEVWSGSGTDRTYRWTTLPGLCVVCMPPHACLGDLVQAWFADPHYPYCYPYLVPCYPFPACLHFPLHFTTAPTSVVPVPCHWGSYQPSFPIYCIVACPSFPASFPHLVTTHPPSLCVFLPPPPPALFACSCYCDIIPLLCVYLFITTLWVLPQFLPATRACLGFAAFCLHGAPFLLCLMCLPLPCVLLITYLPSPCPSPALLLPSHCAPYCALYPHPMGNCWRGLPTCHPLHTCHYNIWLLLCSSPTWFCSPILPTIILLALPTPIYSFYLFFFFLPHYFICYAVAGSSSPSPSPASATCGLVPPFLLI